MHLRIVNATHFRKIKNHRKIPTKSTNCQKLFVEPAYLAHPIHKVNLQYPVPLSARRISGPHTVLVLRMDIESDFVPCDLLVRKHANKVSCDGAAILPASLLGQSLRVAVQFHAGDIKVFLKIVFAAGECLCDVAAKFLLERIISDHEGAAEVSFPLLENRTEVEKYDVILGNRQIWRILIIGCQSVAARPHDALVPVARNPIIRAAST
jgi:hypothetical protein